MTKKELIAEMYKVSRLTGHFQLHSGEESPVFFDKYLFASNPYLLSEIIYYLKEITPDDAQVLAGLELGGISLVTALSLKTGINMAYVRKAAKEYGTCKLIEGALVEGKRICIVDDVVETGNQILESALALRKEGAIVTDAVCVLSKDDSSYYMLKAEGIKLTPLFSMKNMSEKDGIKLIRD